MLKKLKDMIKNNYVLYIVAISVYRILRNVLCYLYVCVQKIITRNSVIFSECCIVHQCFRFKKNNWGDDLNEFLWEYISSKKCVSIPYSILFFKKFTCYSLIGSIISFYDLSNKIIYGSGLISPYEKITGKPKKIYSVRGPLTREYLIKTGIECPEKYGDPAILLPLFYRPVRKLNTRGSIIANMGTDTSDNVCFHELCDRLNLNVINLVDYEKWTDVIDEIANSEFVISESLHGLIVAETYGVPNVWVEFKDHPNYWTFKFYDYFYSIGKKEKIIQLQKNIPYDELTYKIQTWKKGEIDYKRMFSYIPFDVKCNVDFHFADKN